MATGLPSFHLFGQQSCALTREVVSLGFGFFWGGLGVSKVEGLGLRKLEGLGLSEVWAGV